LRAEQLAATWKSGAFSAALRVQEAMGLQQGIKDEPGRRRTTETVGPENHKRPTGNPITPEESASILKLSKIAAPGAI
jgi:hypothetical protein